MDGSVRLEIVLSPKQRAAFVEALTGDFDSIATSLSKVDARKATAWVADDLRMITAAVEGGCGFAQLNSTVHGLLRDWVADSGRQALRALPAKLRGTSALLGTLALLLRDQGKLGEAEPLYLEALAARRETLGDRHPDTLNSINNLAILILLSDQGKLGDAEALRLEARARLADATGLYASLLSQALTPCAPSLVFDRCKYKL